MLYMHSHSCMSSIYLYIYYTYIYVVCVCLHIYINITCVCTAPRADRLPHNCSTSLLLTKCCLRKAPLLPMTDASGLHRSGSKRNITTQKPPLIVSRRTCLAIAAAFETLPVLLSFLRFILPSPFEPADKPHQMRCYSGGSISAADTDDFSIGSRIVYRTRIFEQSAMQPADEMDMDASSVFRTEIDVIQRGMIYAEMSPIGSERFFVIFKPDGTLEEGVSSDCILAVREPLIQLCKLNHSNHSSSPATVSGDKGICKGAGMQCSTGHLVQILQFVTSSRFSRLRTAHILQVFDSNYAASLDASLDSLIGHLLTSLASSMAHISASLNVPSSSANSQREKIIHLRLDLCDQIQTVCSSIFKPWAIHNGGKLTPIDVLESPDWMPFLQYFEAFLVNLLKQNWEYSEDGVLMLEDGRASPYASPDTERTM